MACEKRKILSIVNEQKTPAARDGFARRAIVVLSDETASSQSVKGTSAGRIGDARRNVDAKRIEDGGGWRCGILLQ
jgi:hypothetical protein